MDTPEAELKHMQAGRDYLKAIEALGLELAALFWAKDDIAKQYVLVMFTDVFDYIGPYEISKKLFDAYNLAGTPKSIDPFIVRLHSPQQQIAKAIDQVFGVELKLFGPDAKTGLRKPVDMTNSVLTISSGGLTFKKTWMIKYSGLQGRSPKTLDLSRKWRRFERNVQALAA